MYTLFIYNFYNFWFFFYKKLAKFIEISGHTEPYVEWFLPSDDETKPIHNLQGLARADLGQVS